MSSRSLLALRAGSGRSLTPQLRSHRQVRRNASYQPPTPQPPPENPGNAHRNFWKSFGRPVAKVFLGALFTYQVTYYAWYKLEAMEEQHDGDAEIKGLEAELASLQEQKGLKAGKK